MQSIAKTPKAYIDSLAADKKTAISKLRAVVLKNLLEGFKEGMASGMIGYSVPHSLYPKGYHVDPKLPLGFMCIAAQKNFIALYHMGIYADKKLPDWFVKEYPKHAKTKLDMGMSCIRFKKIDDIPYELVGQLAKKLTPKKWISIYEEQLKLAQLAKESRKKSK